MSKLLKAITHKHRPAIAAKMTPANGYDENKHTHVADLKKAGVISTPEANDLDECLDELLGDGNQAASFLKNAKTGKAKDKLNDADFVASLMALDDDGDNLDAAALAS